MLWWKSLVVVFLPRQTQFVKGENLPPLNFVETSAINAVQMGGVILGSAPCQNCLENYRENSRLVLALGAAQGFSSLITMQYATAGTQAGIAVFGEDFGNKLTGATDEEVKQYYNLIQEKMTDITRERSPLISEDLEEATRLLEQLVMRCGPFVHGMFEGVIKTIAIQSWGVFELMTRQLWHAATSTGTASIVLPAVNGGRKSKPGFGSRRTIRTTFETTFAVDNDEIMAALLPEKIDPLAIFRNVLVHHGGHVDQTFKDDSHGFEILEPIRNLNLGEKINVDGGLVRALADPVFSSGYELISAVNEWLATHH